MKHCYICRRRREVLHPLKIGDHLCYWTCRDCVDEVKRIVDSITRVCSR